MVIAQITDIHISDDLKAVHEVDVVANFRNVLNDVRKDGEADVVALTGDLCFRNGSERTMLWVKDEMDAAGIPYHVISGNHDDSAMMSSVFGMEKHLHNGELYYSRRIDGLDLVFLDTAKGRLSGLQLEWLREHNRASAGPSLIFMHHPPVHCVPYMDRNYALEDMADVQDVLSGLQNVSAIFSGHYHVEKSVQKSGMATVHITPSTFFQLDDRDAEFRIGTKRIGWRKIGWKDGQLQTSVKWV